MTPATPNEKVIGLIATIVGGLLVMGGLMFGLVSLLMPTKPRLILVAPVVQIALGLFGSVAGMLVMRGYARAKWALLFAAVGVVANLAFLVVVFVGNVR